MRTTNRVRSTAAPSNTLALGFINTEVCQVNKCPVLRFTPVQTPPRWLLEEQRRGRELKHYQSLHRVRWGFYLRDTELNITAVWWKTPKCIKASGATGHQRWYEKGLILIRLLCCCSWVWRTFGTCENLNFALFLLHEVVKMSVVVVSVAIVTIIAPLRMNQRNQAYVYSAAHLPKSQTLFYRQYSTTTHLCGEQAVNLWLMTQWCFYIFTVIMS